MVWGYRTTLPITLNKRRNRGPAIHHFNRPGINLQVDKPQENVNIKIIRPSEPLTFGQRSTPLPMALYKSWPCHRDGRCSDCRPIIFHILDCILLKCNLNK